MENSWEELDHRGHRFGGIMAITNTRTSRSYFVGTQNIGKRLWDHRDWLRKGVHPCPALQRDWTARPDDFKFFLVQRVWGSFLLPHIKQMWMDRMRKEGRCYNQKSALPQKRKKRRKPVPLPPLTGLLTAPPDVSRNAMDEWITIRATAKLPAWTRRQDDDALLQWAKTLLANTRRETSSLTSVHE